MNENPLIEKIDAVIYTLRDNFEGLSFDDIFNNVFKTDAQTPKEHNELLLILAKLEDEGYITNAYPGVTVTPNKQFKITFDGLIFALEGCYDAYDREKRTIREQAQLQDKRQIEAQNKQIEMLMEQVDEMAEQRKIQKSVRTLTAWIALGTIAAAVYYIIQVAHYITHLGVPQSCSCAS